MGDTWAFIAIGLVVGALSGLIGIGGAVVIVPVLVLFFGFTQGRAQGTTIGALVPPIGILAAVQYYRNGMLDVRVAALLGLGFVFGALGGATLVPHVPQVWLKRIFASALVYIAAQLVFADPQRKAAGALPGLLAIGFLWIAYAVKRAIGRKTKPPEHKPPPPDTEYYI